MSGETEHRNRGTLGDWLGPKRRLTLRCWWVTSLRPLLTTCLKCLGGEDLGICQSPCSPSDRKQTNHTWRNAEYLRRGHAKNSWNSTPRDESAMQDPYSGRENETATDSAPITRKRTKGQAEMQEHPAHHPEPTKGTSGNTHKLSHKLRRPRNVHMVKWMSHQRSSLAFQVSSRKGTQPPDVQNAISQEMIDLKYPQDFWTLVYTNGSSQNTVRNGESGFFYQTPRLRHPFHRNTSRCPMLKLPSWDKSPHHCNWIPYHHQ